MSLQPRHKWMAEIAAGCFEREPSQIEDVMREHANLKRLNDFLEGKSKHHHIFLFDQKADVINESGEAIDGHGESKVLWAAISGLKFQSLNSNSRELELSNLLGLVLGGGGGRPALSKPNFARKYSLESSRRDLHNALLCTVL